MDNRGRLYILHIWLIFTVLSTWTLPSTLNPGLSFTQLITHIGIIIFYAIHIPVYVYNIVLQLHIPGDRVG
jgi:dolichyl-phosphate-mannose--protein O-mannosyl transferase